MSLISRFKRAVRARAHGTLDDLGESFGELTRHEPEPELPPAPSAAPRGFAIGDKVIVQRDGLCEITGRTTFDHDGIPQPVFELKSRRAGRLVPESRARSVMRHLVGREGAEIARQLLLAEEHATDPRPWAERRVELETAFQKLDLGPEAQGVRDLASRPGPLADDERKLFEAMREVVCDEIETVLGLPAGSLAEELERRFGGGR